MVIVIYTVEVVVFALQMVVVLNYISGAPDLSFPLQMIVGENKMLTN
jgi:hypothetical protein